MAYPHIPVMRQEVLHYLHCRPGGIYADGTLGGTGHARAILEKSAPDGILIGCDQDADAISNATEALAPFCRRVHLFHGNFVQLPIFFSQLHIDRVDGILLDLGMSMHHLKNSGRGFSFQKDEPLDMRMNTDTDTTAEDIVNTETEEGLIRIFREYGEQRWARPIARRIVSVRHRQRIRTSALLVDIVCNALPQKSLRNRRIHPATRVFMALRIAVNHELEHLATFMDMAAGLLNADGRLCVLSYHSLEDRIVKHRIKRLEKGCRCPSDFPKCICNQKATVRNLTRKPVCPKSGEIQLNPMARSARLRAFEKISIEPLSPEPGSTLAG
jgi:16S rRNA (cytosine1402-N4)-methyltransferase